MKVVQEYPPNYDDICKVFPEVKDKKGVLFCWGTTIFNPGGDPLSKPIMAHEELHCAQQHFGNLLPSKWWARYLEDLTFRYDQELAAHAREYKVYCDLHKDRNVQVQYLYLIANRLASPMYGSMVKASMARQDIKDTASNSRSKPIFIMKNLTEHLDVSTNPIEP